MNPGSIWWDQIGNSMQFVNQVIVNMRDNKSTVLQIQNHLPWKQVLYQTIDRRRNVFCGQRRFLRLEWEAEADPGAFVLETLCSDMVRADYYPGYTYAQYLGTRKDADLCECIIWIAGIHDQHDLLAWTDFVSQYLRFAQNQDQAAVFVLEYDGPQTKSCKIHRIPYCVEPYDCRVFCLEAAAALQNSALRIFQAELALSISESDPELCWILQNTGDTLIKAPLATTNQCLLDHCRSDGSRFPRMTEQQITSAARKAAIVLLFPILERYRMDFITKHDASLRHHLPISNAFGVQISDPFDLEISQLRHIVNSNSRGFDNDEITAINLCKKTRDLLAHNKAVPYEAIQSVMAL